MPHLLLTPRTDIQDTFRLAETAQHIGWTVERAAAYHPPAELRDQDVVLYGETLFTTLAARSLNLAVLEPHFDWLAHLPEEYLSREVIYTTLGEARKETRPKFVKSADGNKAVDSRVYARGEDLPTRFISKDLPVLVADPVTWEVEYRIFILEKAILTFSVYARFGELELGDAPQAEIDAALGFCSTVLQDKRISMPPSMVLDVGKIKGKDWAVIEPNPVSSSGIYACDAEKVLLALKRACIRQEIAVGSDDSQWIVDHAI